MKNHDSQKSIFYKIQTVTSATIYQTLGQKNCLKFQYFKQKTISQIQEIKNLVEKRSNSIFVDVSEQIEAVLRNREWKLTVFLFSSWVKFSVSYYIQLEK